MNEFFNRLKKINLSTLIIIVGIIILIIVSLSTTNVQKKENIKIFTYNNQNKEDIYTIINNLQEKINLLQKELNNNKKLMFNNLQGKNKIENKLIELMRNNGNIIKKTKLSDGSILVTTDNGKKFLVHPDGTIEEIKDYKIGHDGKVMITDKNGKKYEYNPQKVIFKKKLPDGSMLIKTADGKIKIIKPDGTIEEIKGYKINPDGSITITDKNGNKKIIKNSNKIKLKKIPLENVKKIIDKNGNMYFKDKDGNWYMKTPEGEIKKLGKYLNIDKNGNIIDKNGNILGQVFSKETNDNQLLDKDGNLITQVKEAKTNDKIKLLKSEKLLNKLKNLHGKIKDKKILEDGSMLVTTADGKKFLVHPDGTIEEIKDYKVNKDGSVTITDKDGIKKQKKLSNSEKFLEKFLKSKKLKNKTYLKDGSMLVTTADGKKFLVFPDGTIEEIKDYKVDKDGSVTITDKNGNKLTKRKLSIPEKIKRELESKYGKVKDSHLLSDGSLLITTADGKKFLIHPDGKVERIKNYKINKNGKVTIESLKLIIKKEKLFKYDFLFTSIIEKEGPYNKVIRTNTFDTFVFPISLYSKFVNKNGNVIDIQSFSKIKNTFIIYLKNGKKLIIDENLQTNSLLNLINKFSDKNKIVDFHLTNKNNIIFTLQNNNKFLIKENGNIKKIISYSILPSGYIKYKLSNIIISQLNKNLEAANKKLNKIIDKKILSDGSILITTADGKKFLIHPNGKVERIKNYQINDDGTVKIIDKNGNVKKMNGLTFLKKIFTDKNGKKYLLDKNGHKHYIKDGYIDENGNLVYTDKNGKTHILVNTGKDLILKEYKNGKKEILGYGKIINIGNNKKLVLTKIFYNKKGYPLRFISLTNKEFEEINNKVYLNNQFLFNGKIYLKGKKVFVENTDKNKIYLKTNLNNLRNYNYKTYIFKEKNNNRLILIKKNNLYFLYKNGEIEKLENINFTLKDNILYVTFLKENAETKKYYIAKEKYFPVIKNKDTLYIYLFGNNFITSKEYFPLFYKINNELLKLKLKNKNITLLNSYYYKLLTSKENTNKSIYISNDNFCIKKGNKYFYKGLISNKVCKTNKKIKGKNYYLYDLYNTTNNIIQFNKNSFFIYPLTKIKKAEGNLYLLKNKFKKIIISNLNSINYGLYIKDKGLVFKYNNRNYIISNNSYKKLLDGDISIVDGKIILKTKNGEQYILGEADKYKDNFKIDNGVIENKIITKDEINEINKLNNGEITNNYFNIFCYGTKVYLTNNSTVFYDKKLNVIYINELGNIENLSKGKIYLNKLTNKVYFVNIDKYKFLGFLDHVEYKNNIIYQTTNGSFYLKNNNLYKLDDNFKLYDLKLSPYIENLILYGINKNSEKIKLGKIINIFEGKIINNKASIISGNLNDILLKDENKKLIDKNYQLKNDNLFVVKKGKKILLGKFITNGKRYIVYKDKNGKTHIIDKKDNKELRFKKNNNGEIIITKDGKNIVPTEEIKIKKGNVYLNNQKIDNLDFGKNIYKKRKEKKVKLLSEEEFNNLFKTEIKKREDLLKQKTKVKKDLKPIKKMTYNANYENTRKYKLVVKESNNAIKKNFELFFNKTNNIEKPIIINSDNGTLAKNINEKRHYFLVPGIKIPVVLVGGSLAPLTSVANTTNQAGQQSIQTIAKFVPKSYFVITKNIVMPDGNIIPMAKGIIVTTPYATTSQRMFYQPESLYFYDEDNNSWYYASISGDIISKTDNVPGLPGILIDTRNKYIAKATIYSILEGISKFLLNSSSALAAAQNATDTVTGDSPVGTQIGTTILGGAGTQLKNLSSLFMAIINSQVPYLAVQNGEKGYFIINKLVEFRLLFGNR